MKEYFAKLSDTISRSTIWQAPMHTKIVWITMLSLSDKYGNVKGSIPGLASLSVVSIEQCEDALEHLLSPDKYSRTKEHEGRRIEEIDGGWLILNYRKYRGETSEERKKRYNRERLAEIRKNTTLNNKKQQSPELSHTDTDTDPDPNADKKKERKNTKKETRQEDFGRCWALYPKKVSKGQAEATWKKLAKDGILPDLETLRAAIERYKVTVAGKPGYTKHFSTWLNARCWEDEHTSANSSGKYDVDYTQRGHD